MDVARKKCLFDRLNYGPPPAPTLPAVGKPAPRAVDATTGSPGRRPRPSSRKMSSCSAVSMPSATTLRPSALPRVSTARTISTFCGFVPMPATNERSIFRLSMGRVLR